ncbi:hypothetical protein [Seonamhaeicola marinus]|uniref:DUF3887 domain-containing protein n=1 Tax=Seonamhaeicola marinus TaxID=1912246 RepID=A0A5D0HM35_9FLAO|nr:hypothetical protein [Seonamhaeicola marinus]TYA71359.1 hypothetical protein FUA24_17400 [Seonamhaeicola marinus]
MKNLLILILLCSSLNISSQSTPKELLDSFFSTYAESPEKAVRDLYATNKWTKVKKDNIEKVVQTINSLTEDFMGKYYGNELIITKKLSQSFALYSYMIKYDRQPLRFIFKFYKPNDKWMLFAFSFDDDLDDEIKEAAKLQNLNFDKN